MSAIAESEDSPDLKIERWVETFVRLTEERPYFPTLMMREIAEGAPRLDQATGAGRIRVIIAAFARILAEGQQRGLFRPMHPILAYLTVFAPLMFNAARERAAAGHGHTDFPMFVEVSHADLTRHMQRVALRMLQKD